MKTLQYKEITGNAQDFVKRVRAQQEPIKVIEKSGSSIFILRQEDLENLIVDQSPEDSLPPLTTEQIAKIEKGFKSIEEGRCVTHKEHKKNFRQWLQKEHNITL